MSPLALPLAVLGGTGAVGEQLLPLLSESKLPIASLQVYASRSPRSERVDFRGESIAVQSLSDLSRWDATAAIVCLPPSMAQKILPILRQRGVVVIDVGNSAGQGGALVLPGVQAALPEAAVAERFARTPSPAGWLLSRLIAPLSGAGLTHASGVLSLPASAWGHRAVSELGEQVKALFNLADPPRRLFPDGLAFDTLVEDVPMEEWSSTEQQARAEVEALTGFAGAAVQVAIQPLFNGVSVGLHLRGVTVGQVEEAYRGVSGLVMVERTGKLRPRAAVERSGVYWGRLREDPSGDGVHLWAVADNLSGAGAVTPVRTLEWMVAAGLPGGDA